MNCKSSRFQFSYFLRIHSFSSELVFRYSWINFAKDFAITEGILIPGNKRDHYCTTSFNWVWTQVLRRFKPCSRRVGDSRWWGSLTVVPAGNKAKRLSPVNHTTKTIHHHVGRENIPKICTTDFHVTLNAEVVTRRKCRGSCARSYATLRSGTHQISRKAQKSKSHKKVIKSINFILWS